MELSSDGGQAVCSFRGTDSTFSPETMGEGRWQREEAGQSWALESAAWVHPHGTSCVRQQLNRLTSLSLVVFLCKMR